MESLSKNRQGAKQCRVAKYFRPMILSVLMDIEPTSSPGQTAGLGRHLLALAAFTLVYLGLLGLYPALPPQDDGLFYAFVTQDLKSWFWSPGVLPRLTHIMGMAASAVLAGGTENGMVLWGLVLAGGIIWLAFDSARSLGGVWAGWLAVLLSAFYPLLLANATAATPDNALVFFSLLPVWLLIRWGSRAVWPWLLAGALAPLALVSKSAGVALLPALAAMALVSPGRAGVWRRLAWLAGGLGGALGLGILGAALVSGLGLSRLFDMAGQFMGWVVVRTEHHSLATEPAPSLYANWLARLSMHDTVAFLALPLCALIAPFQTNRRVAGLWVLALTSLAVHVFGLVVMPGQLAVGRYSSAFVIPALIACSPWLAGQASLPIPWNQCLAVFKKAALITALVLAGFLIMVLLKPQDSLASLASRCLFLVGPWLLLAGVGFLAWPNGSPTGRQAVLLLLLSLLAVRGVSREVIGLHFQRSALYQSERQMADYLSQRGCRTLQVERPPRGTHDLSASAMALYFPGRLKVIYLDPGSDVCDAPGPYLVINRQPPAALPCSDSWRLVARGRTGWLLERKP